MPDIILPPTIPDASTPPSYPELPPEPQGPWLARNRKSAILGGIVVLLAVAIGVTALIQRRPANIDGVNTADTQTVNSDVNVQTTPIGSTNRPTFSRYDATVTRDEDRDGLTDDEERQAGTTFDVADTDGDGLTDYDEVKVYRSDPKKTDTDGDGKNDSQEVSAGTSPNGPGLLLNISQAITNLQNTNQ